jgi:hypothetical protein
VCACMRLISFHILRVLNGWVGICSFLEADLFFMCMRECTNHLESRVKQKKTKLSVIFLYHLKSSLHTHIVMSMWQHRLIDLCVLIVLTFYRTLLNKKNLYYMKTYTYGCIKSIFFCIPIILYKYYITLVPVVSFCFHSFHKILVFFSSLVNRIGNMLKHTHTHTHTHTYTHTHISASNKRTFSRSFFALVSIA